MGNFETPRRTYGLNALGEGQAGGLKTEEYTIKRGELRRVNGEETTQGHVKNILSKLGLHDRTEAVAVAVRRGIVHID